MQNDRSQSQNKPSKMDPKVEIESTREFSNKIPTRCPHLRVSRNLKWHYDKGVDMGCSGMFDQEGDGA